MNSSSLETEVAEDAMACLALAGQVRFERFKNESPRLAVAQAELLYVEKRLGTRDERPEDIHLAVALGHEIRNILCIYMLRRPAA